MTNHECPDCRKIAGVRAKTVENGCAPEEAKAAAAKAAQMEAQHNPKTCTKSAIANDFRDFDWARYYADSRADLRDFFAKQRAEREEAERAREEAERAREAAKRAREAAKWRFAGVAGGQSRVPWSETKYAGGPVVVEMEAAGRYVKIGGAASPEDALTGLLIHWLEDTAPARYHINGPRGKSLAFIWRSNGSPETANVAVTVLHETTRFGNVVPIEDSVHRYLRCGLVRVEGRERVEVTPVDTCGRATGPAWLIPDEPGGGEPPGKLIAPHAPASAPGAKGVAAEPPTTPPPVTTPTDPANGRPTPPDTRGAAWAAFAPPLADWTSRHIVTCWDVFGTHYFDADGASRRCLAKEALTRDVLVRHYQGERIIGIPSTTTDNLCLCVAADIDAHDKDTEADPARNLACAVAAAKFLHEMFGLHAIVCDSNGKGGYHVRVFFKKAVPSATARWLCDQLEAHLAGRGFPPIETFPKQECLGPQTKYGNWLRLPGKHHSRDHWTRIMGSAPGEWLEGAAAVKRLLTIAGDDTKALLDAYRDAQPARPRPRHATRATSNRMPSEATGKPLEAWVRDALEHMPNDGDGVHYDDWLGVGIALNNWGAEEGLEIWIEWSAKSNKHVEATCRDKWPSFTSDGARTIWALLSDARRNGWRAPWDGPPPEDGEMPEYLRDRAALRDDWPPEPPTNGHVSERSEADGARPLVPPDEEPPRAREPGEDDDLGKETSPPDGIYRNYTDADLGIIPAVDVQAKNVRWLWHERIAVGKLTLLAGPGGDGKSQIGLAIAASVTSGRPLFDGNIPTKGRVIILAAEDDREDTIKPRLLALNANIVNVTFLTARVKITRKEEGKTLTFVSPMSFADLGYWKEIKRRLPDTVLIIADTLPSYVGRSFDDNKNKDVRDALEPFVGWLGEEEISLLGITHTGKARDHDSALNKILGSVGYTNLARGVFMTWRDPENPDRRIFTHAKSNIGPLGDAYAYTIARAETDEGGEVINTSAIVWDPTPIRKDADQIMEEIRRSKKPGPKPSTRPEAVAFIVAELTRRNDQPGVDILHAWTDSGKGENDFWRARKDLIEEGRLAVDDTCKPKRWHLNATGDHEDIPI